MKQKKGDIRGRSPLIHQHTREQGGFLQTPARQPTPWKREKEEEREGEGAATPPRCER